jgi:DNA-binding NarL/FixJ family response regulator
MQASVARHRPNRVTARTRATIRATAASKFRGYAVVAEASCAAEALAAVERLAPDAGLLDVRLGEESGHDVARRVEPARRRRDLLRRRRLCASHIVSSGAHPIRTMR